MISKDWLSLTSEERARRLALAAAASASVDVLLTRRAVEAGHTEGGEPECTPLKDRP